MRTDTIFYQLFVIRHSLLFELLNQPIENAEGYEFISVEVEKAFRLDGIFFPPDRDKSPHSARLLPGRGILFSHSSR
jgi:predicted transposase YdaD